MIDEVETFDFKFIKDAAEAQRKGYGELTAEPAGRRWHASFAEYVVRPSLLFGFMAWLIWGGFVGLAIVLYLRFANVGLSWDLVGVAFISATIAGASVIAYSGLIFQKDWRKLQWKYKQQMLGIAKKQNDQTRPMIEAHPGMRRISRVTWQNGGIKELARRCHDETGRWTAGRELNRKLFENPPLYRNVSENYNLLCQTLFEWGWINDPDPKNRPRWLNKGKLDLRGDLFIS